MYVCMCVCGCLEDSTCVCTYVYVCSCECAFENVGVGGCLCSGVYVIIFGVSTSCYHLSV